MPQRLFLLDGMALAYRAHFAFGARPIRMSSGFNTSALFGFIATLLDILQKGAPTHVAVAFDTDAPTPRHEAFPDYKAQREVMPEELSAALPHLRRVIGCFRIPVLDLDGYEADDLIGTLVRRAEPAGFESFMVTPDKDFGQLVTERIRLWKPGRQGGEVEILSPTEVCARWDIARVSQVVDMLGLMGDTSDNIPGVPGIGEKTAAKLLAQFDTLEGVLAHAAEIPGRVGEALRTHADTARLSKQLATILTDVPLDVRFEDLLLQGRDDAALRAICVEFEFNALGKRLFGADFRAGRGFGHPAAVPGGVPAPSGAGSQDDLFNESPADARPRTRRRGATSASARSEPPAAAAAESASPPATVVNLRTLADVPHAYTPVRTTSERRALLQELGKHPAFAFHLETDGPDPRTARPLGIAFCVEAGRAWYVPVTPSGPVTDATDTDSKPAKSRAGASPLATELSDLAPFLTDERVVKIGHNLKFDLLVFRWNGVEVRGPFFDTQIAHALVEPDLRHGLDYLSEALLGYYPISMEELIGPAGSPQKSLAELPVETVAQHAAEAGDVAWQLYERLRPRLLERDQERVFHHVEMPVLPALVAMEYEGIRVDATALADYSRTLARDMSEAEADIHRMAARPFNVNSNRQLGEVLFEELRLVEKARKTPSGQYATDEQTLLSLANQHGIVARLLDYRAVAKLKSTYADALPAAIFPPTGRIHTTFHQAATATGRLSSVDPNLQNIPIRTDRGQEIRRAFVPRPGWRLLSADYSQVELRILAALGGDTAMIEAFRQGADIHTATAARVFGVATDEVTAEMRRRAKMVNFGIAYGISAFGLAQRLGIPRGEAARIIEHYFLSYPGIRRYMDETIAFARERGYVETLTGRRRYLRDIHSANGPVRGAAERNAINSPIQGTAADMIKIAMARIYEETVRRGLKTRLLLQVHDELVLDLHPEEESEVRPLVESGMRTALPLPGDVPIAVEIGTGANWLEAH